MGVRVKASRLVLGLGAVFTVLAAVLVPLAVMGTHATLRAVAPGARAASPVRVCGQPILDSPWDYDGAAGTYTTSGTPAGLPTFGAPGTDFPSATKVIVVPAGNNTSAANGGKYDVDNAVVYFEPGMHDIEARMYAGYDSAYVGGFTPSAGKAVMNGVDGATGGTGVGGDLFEQAPIVSRNKVDDTWEYLTIENYTSTTGDSFLGNNGTGYDDGDTWKYDTIGPNEYGRVGSDSPPALNTPESPGKGGGYAIDLGSYVTIEYSCLTQNAEGAFNNGGVGDVIANNEISWNGLGEYPDLGAGGPPGTSPNTCGCSGGGKLFFTLNVDVVNNYVHDNYNKGIWFDFDNSGMLISHNYVADNFAEGIMVEGSFNADIADNTLIGNGWASNGAWPAGYGGGACDSKGDSCAVGEGLLDGYGGSFPYGAIYLPNTGGNPNLTQVAIPSSIAVPGCASACMVKVRYPGHLYVQGNVLVNNFGGINVYTDTNRYPGNIDGDSTCAQPLGSMNQPNSTTYYLQTYELDTASDTSISGAAVSSTGGTFALCDNYGVSGGPSGNNVRTAQPAVAGMEVFDESTGKLVGTVSSVSSDTSFTLKADPPGGSYNAGDALLLSDTGGCGPADYYGGGPGTASGSPSADYWDNCIWGSRNVTVSGNTLSINASRVTGCTAANLCGFNGIFGVIPGIPHLTRYFCNGYVYYMANAPGTRTSLGNVFKDNTYEWSGGGAGGWGFWAGLQSNQVTWSRWQSVYGQDAGSTRG